MTGLLAGIALLAILAGQLLGYLGRKKPFLDNIMFCCWGLSFICAAFIVALNCQDARNLTSLLGFFGF